MNSRLFLNFIFHQLLITYNAIKNFYFAFSSPSDFQVGGAMRFFKNASKKVIQGRGKKASAILGGRAQKVALPLTQEKNGGRVQKSKNNEDRRIRHWNEKLVICVFAVEHADVTMSVNARNCVKDSTLTTQRFLLLLLFSLVLLQQVFCKIPANQIIISTYN